jgi:hypothetical protein
MFDCYSEVHRRGSWVGVTEITAVFLAGKFQKTDAFHYSFTFASEHFSSAFHRSVLLVNHFRALQV